MVFQTNANTLWKSIQSFPHYGFFTCVPFCLRSLRPFERCVKSGWQIESAFISCLSVSTLCLRVCFISVNPECAFTINKITVLLKQSRDQQGMEKKTSFDFGTIDDANVGGRGLCSMERRPQASPAPGSARAGAPVTTKMSSTSALVMVVYVCCLWFQFIGASMFVYGFFSVRSPAALGGQTSNQTNENGAGQNYCRTSEKEHSCNNVTRWVTHTSFY